MSESRWQININRKNYSEPVDMDAVRRACAEWMVEEQTNNSGSTGAFVYVRLGTVGLAVDAINALGYTTDEDEEEVRDREKIADELGL